MRTREPGAPPEKSSFKGCLTRTPQRAVVASLMRTDCASRIAPRHASLPQARRSGSFRAPTSSAKPKRWMCTGGSASAESKRKTPRIARRVCTMSLQDWWVGDEQSSARGGQQCCTAPSGRAKVEASKPTNQRHKVRIDLSTGLERSESDGSEGGASPFTTQPRSSSCDTAVWFSFPGVFTTERRLHRRRRNNTRLDFARRAISLSVTTNLTTHYISSKWKPLMLKKATRIMAAMERARTQKKMYPDSWFSSHMFGDPSSLTKFIPKIPESV